MKRSARLRASAVLLVLLGAVLSCLLLGASPDSRSCCSDGSCQAMLDSRCCDASSSIPGTRSDGVPSLIADRVEHLGAPRCVDMCRLLPASRPPSSASGIRTTVLRL